MADLDRVADAVDAPAAAAPAAAMDAAADLPARQAAALVRRTRRAYPAYRRDGRPTRHPACLPACCLPPQSKEARVRQAQGELEKDTGNAQLKDGKFMAAVQCYTRGMAFDPASPLLPANRALAFLKLKKCGPVSPSRTIGGGGGGGKDGAGADGPGARRFAEAEKDCDAALALDPAYVKAWARRGAARRGRQLYALALEGVSSPSLPRYSMGIGRRPCLWSTCPGKEKLGLANWPSPTARQTSKRCCRSRPATPRRRRPSKSCKRHGGPCVVVSLHVPAALTAVGCAAGQGAGRARVPHVQPARRCSRDPGGAGGPGGGPGGGGGRATKPE